jgi:hypothetical protein
LNKERRKLVEECFYAKKYIPGKMRALAEILDDMFPQTSNSVVKMIGKPHAKTPLDTSVTERWGIKRATCDEAMEYEAKRKLLKHIKLIMDMLTIQEVLLVNCKYDREMSIYEIMRELHVSRATYFRLKNSALNKAWGYLRLIEKELKTAIK